jgi:hypothetical protein
MRRGKLGFPGREREKWRRGSRWERHGAVVVEWLASTVTWGKSGHEPLVLSRREEEKEKERTAKGYGPRKLGWGRSGPVLGLVGCS